MKNIDDSLPSKITSFKKNQLIEISYKILSALAYGVAFVLITNDSIPSGMVFIILAYISLNHIRDSAYHMIGGDNPNSSKLVLLDSNQKLNDSNTTLTRYTSPKDLAEWIALILLEGKPPFDTEWISKDTSSISTEIKQVAYWGTLSYSLYIYIKMISEKFGENTARQVRNQFLQIIKNQSNNQNEELEFLKYKINMIEYGFIIIDYIIELISKAKNEILINDFYEYNISAAFLVDFADSPFCIDRSNHKSLDRNDYIGVENISGINNCQLVSRRFTEVKKMAMTKFKSYLDSIEVQIMNDILWSEKPGRFEKHLQRKYDNPLLYQGSEKITQSVVDIAKAKDTNNHIKFKEDLIGLLQKIAEKNQQSENHTSEREIIDNLTLSAFRNGGKSLDSLPWLYNLRNSYISDLKASYAGNTKSLNALESAERYYQTSIVRIYHNEFMAQMTMEDSVMLENDDLIATLLAEDIGSMKLFFENIEKSQDTHTVNRFKQQLNIKISLLLLSNNGDAIPMLDEKSDFLTAKMAITNRHTES